MRRELGLELDGHNVMPRHRKSGGGRAGARPKLKDPEGLRPGVPSYCVEVGVAVVCVELAPSTSPVGPLVLLGIEARHPLHAAILSYHTDMGYSDPTHRAPLGHCVHGS